jgi:hypothetical protein
LLRIKWLNDVFEIFIIINKLLKTKIMKFSKEQLLGIVRHSLTFIGGIFITKGLIDESILNEVIGGAIALTGAIWSIVVKNKA